MRTALIAIPLLFTGLQNAAAQPPPVNPDWPCQQRLVPELQAGSYWSGPAVPAGDFTWHDDEKLAALVETTVNRDTPDSEALQGLTAYADSVPNDQRVTALPRLFGALVGETNDERNLIVARIETIAHRQRDMGDVISKLSNEADAIPSTATGDAAAKKNDLAGQRDFNIKAFQDAQHTIRYACEVPGTFERRLGLFAKVLQEKVGK